LSLAYAETHPDRVKALVLRGIFTLRRKELIWFYQEGASFVYPDHWDNYLAVIPEAEVRLEGCFEPTHMHLLSRI
jgi:proline iminopeptidase